MISQYGSGDGDYQERAGCEREELLAEGPVSMRQREDWDRSVGAQS